jgi:hypothetical protein
VTDPATQSHIAETLLGAFVGALFGSVFGYIASYHLARHARQEDVVERRKRLMRALAHEISLEVKDLTWGDVPGRWTLSTGIYLSTLAPLLDLSADMGDDKLLGALAHLKSRSDSFNDVIAWTNPLHTHPMTSAQMDSFMATAQASYQEVKDAAALVVPMLENTQMSQGTAGTDGRWAQRARHGELSLYFGLPTRQHLGDLICGEFIGFSDQPIPRPLAAHSRSPGLSLRWAAWARSVAADAP